MLLITYIHETEGVTMEKNDSRSWVIRDVWLIFTILIITGLTLWNSRELLYPGARGFETYKDFGFTFKHPRGMIFREDNFGDAPASMESGFLQGMISEDPLYIYMEVFWNETSAYQNTIGFVDRFFQRFENSPDEVTGGVQFNITSRSDREICCRFFNVNDRSGTFFRGVLGSWRDDTANRYYMVTYLTTETWEEHELTNYLETLIDSLNVT